ncbi:Conserved hypothetical protein [Ramlibacter tataouinensis TTB310]|uniref:Putative glucose-6-phosphate 1-epimerase n=1 Tax=Ramlibacter tataouinensis (strain ATCC BAA-407 / DSM 14655 / LMG 21543 / TTB310) TaxID=365046 RepID=F5XYB6_RAMTT|nr:Conserved hypothetical protein [Ramlibacter tataouinensis TTB310]
MALPTGDRCVAALQGAQVLSWTPAGSPGERLYLSPGAASDGATAIRGGVPLCFPQFNQRVLGGRPLPKHGFARNRRWTPLGVVAEGEDRIAEFGLANDEETHALWPASFEARVAVRLSPGRLAIGFRVRNTGWACWPFALALHTYLRVDDVTRASLHGLEGAAYWDAVADLDRPQARRFQSGALAVEGETDRVYAGGARVLRLSEPGRTLTVSQSTTLPDTVVWNPGAALCARLADMPADGWRHMLCVEAACIEEPVVLGPGQEWQGWQSFEVVAG